MSQILVIGATGQRGAAMGPALSAPARAQARRDGP